MVELLHSLSNPPIYKTVMNGLNILRKNILIPENFLKKFFTVFAYEKILKNKKMVIKSILSNYKNDVAERIYSGSKDFSIGT